jgi:diphthamide synthase subunit DPH2
MRIVFYLTLFLLVSCGYPDIDSVPSFKDLILSDEELFDLCQLNSTDKSEFDNCIKEKQTN